MDSNTEECIKKGFNTIMDNRCPFCNQDMSNLEILISYQQYFNEEYNILLESLANTTRYLASINLELLVEQTEKAIVANSALVDFWSRHVTVPPAITSIEHLKPLLLTAFENLKIALHLKAADPIKSAEASTIVTFCQKIDEFNAMILEFNMQIASYGARITAFKAAPKAELRTLEADLKKLEAIKKKSESGISSNCLSLQTIIQEINALNLKKDGKQNELEAYSNALFSTYSSKINHYLKTFAPYLEIRNLDSGYIGSSKEPMIKYALHISGHEIKFDDNSLQPSFKYSLSEGDKSALALAFFLARLETDISIKDKIIVFDDPVSSFDLNRKTSTIDNLLAFARKAKQIFVLTHNIVFAGEFWKSAGEISIPRQCSKVAYLLDTSNIVEYDIESELLSAVIKDSMTLKNYISQGAVTDEQKRSIGRCIRPVLESYFHIKFFDLVCDSDWLGNFIGKVRNSVSGDPFYRLYSQVSELTDLNNYSKRFHHRFNHQCDSLPITDAELRAYCERTLVLIQLI